MRLPDAVTTKVTKARVSTALAGAGLLLLTLSLSASQVPRLSAQGLAELCVTPGPAVYYIVLSDLVKEVGGISSRYAILNPGGNPATTYHTFCTNEHDVVTEVSGGQILGHDSHLYELAKIESVPGGYQGYAVVQSDWPITGTVLPPLHNVFLPLVLRSEPEPDVRITYIVYNPPGDDVAGEYVELGNFGLHTVEMTNWTLSDTADHVYVFPTFSLAPSSGVKVWTRACTGDATNLCMGRGSAVWNNEGDTAYLRDADGNLIDEYSYQGD